MTGTPDQFEDFRESILRRIAEAMAIPYDMLTAELDEVDRERRIAIQTVQATAYRMTALIIATIDPRKEGGS